jgi:hypothetical protein
MVVRQYLMDHIAEIFPAVFQLFLRIHQLVQEIRTHHRYLALLLSNASGPRADRERVQNAAGVLTTQTLLMFLLALLYGLQAPADDESCSQLSTFKVNLSSHHSAISPDDRITMVAAVREGCTFQTCS